MFPINEVISEKCFADSDGARKNGENGISEEASPVATFRVRTIHKMDEACTNADDRIRVRTIHKKRFECVQYTKWMRPAPTQMIEIRAKNGGNGFL